VKIFGQPHQVRATVEIMDGFSGHADHSELLEYFSAMGGRREKVFLVHGERSRSEQLQRALADSFSASEVIVPALGDSIEF